MPEMIETPQAPADNDPAFRDAVKAGIAKIREIDRFHELHGPDIDEMTPQRRWQLALLHTEVEKAAATAREALPGRAAEQAAVRVLERGPVSGEAAASYAQFADVVREGASAGKPSQT